MHQYSDQTQTPHRTFHCTPTRSTQYEEGRGGNEGRKDTPSGHNTRLCCAVAVAVAVASGPCADGISGMAGTNECCARVIHRGACSDGDVAIFQVRIAIIGICMLQSIVVVMVIGSL